MTDTSLLAARVRSGLEETLHHGVVAVVAVDGSLLASAGDVDRPFYLRSSAKPFQALVSQESGADLSPLELAMACASHRGHPVQSALVESMLRAGGLAESHLGCPPDWPLDRSAARRLNLAGHRQPRKIWHNCSGKHAGFLRACVAAGWPVESYLSADHPLQRRVVELVSELGGFHAGPVGVDGCGAPVLRTTAEAMALMFAGLASEPALREVFTAMHRYPALVGGNGEGDTSIAVATNSAAKGGAAGCIGVAVEGRLGVAVKSWDGLGEIAAAAAVATLDRLGELTPAVRAALAKVASPDVLGGGRVVGTVEPRLELRIA